MTTRDDLNALADRCEREEASPDIDIQIAKLTGWDRISRRLNGRCVGTFKARFRAVPRFGTSLDAAVTLVPPSCCWQVQMDIAYEPTALVYGHDIHKDCNGASPALALCAAALRARAALIPDGAPEAPPAGPPRCDLNGDEAYEAQRAGCIWCRRIACHADGSETETGPGNA